jgi:hypothetical protein
MKTKVCMLLICLFAVGAIAFAQAKVDGKWTAEIAGGRGGAVPIEEGSVSGNTVKFKQKQMGRGGEVILVYTGTVSGDEIKFKREQEGGQGMPVEFTAKRAQ